MHVHLTKEKGEICATLLVRIYDLGSPLVLIQRNMWNLTEMEFKEFEPRFKSAKTRFELRTGLNLETFNTILSGTNHI